jgi:dihydroneopterin aldolase
MENILRSYPASKLEAGGREREEREAAPLDILRVSDLVLNARIGVWPEEQAVSQRVRFSVEVSVQPRQSVAGDPSSVISYDFILNGIKSIVQQGHTLLVETLAERVAEHCLSDRRALQVRVLVEKIDRVPGAALGCEIVRFQPDG